jgi:Tfx family DNA-binding protein
MPKLYGLLTKRQLEVLRFRAQGLSQKEIAEKLNTSRENITIIERRANKNIQLAKSTLIALKTFGISSIIEVKSGTHLVDIPRIVLNKADEENIRIKANFSQIYDEIKLKVPDRIKRTKVHKDIIIRILPSGEFYIE